MTEPYTAAEVPEIVRQLEEACNLVTGIWRNSVRLTLPDMARLAATLREYERVVKENEALRADKETLHKRLVLAGMDVGVVVQQNGAVGVLCNDLWSFATADLELIPDSELDRCIEVATRFSWDGLTAWACWQRQQEPMRFNGASPADSDQYKAAVAWLSARAAGEG